MDSVKFKLLLSQLKKHRSRGDEWVSKIPSDIQAAFFDNMYVESLQTSNSLLLRTLFDEDNLFYEVEWFLGEWEATNPVETRTITMPSGKKYVISSVECFVDYLVETGVLV